MFRESCPSELTEVSGSGVNVRNEAKKGKRSVWERGNGVSCREQHTKGSMEDDDCAQRWGENDGWELWRETHTLRWSMERQKVFSFVTLHHSLQQWSGLLVDTGRTNTVWSYYSLWTEPNDLFNLKNEKWKTDCLPSLYFTWRYHILGTRCMVNWWIHLSDRLTRLNRGMTHKTAADSCRVMIFK